MYPLLALGQLLLHSLLFLCHAGHLPFLHSHTWTHFVALIPREARDPRLIGIGHGGERRRGGGVISVENLVSVISSNQ